MNLSEDKIRKSLLNFNAAVKSSEITKFLKQKVCPNYFAHMFMSDSSIFLIFQELLPGHVDEIIVLLCKLLEDSPSNAFHIRIHFSSLLLPIVSAYLELPEEDLKCFQRKCVALSLLSETNRQVLL